MRFFVKGKRILALVLAFVLIASNLPLSTPIFAYRRGKGIQGTHYYARLRE